MKHSNSNSRLEAFQPFARISDQPVILKELKEAVMYTRVSSKEQQDKTLSLDFQLKTINEYAERNGFTIRASFGGKFESAKTDGRKEFNRMLDYVRQKKGTIGYVLTYTPRVSAVPVAGLSSWLLICVRSMGFNCWP